MLLTVRVCIFSVFQDQPSESYRIDKGKITDVVDFLHVSIGKVHDGTEDIVKLYLFSHKDVKNIFVFTLNVECPICWKNDG